MGYSWNIPNYLQYGAELTFTKGYIFQLPATFILSLHCYGESYWNRRLILAQPSSPSWIPAQTWFLQVSALVSLSISSTESPQSLSTVSSPDVLHVLTLSRLPPPHVTVQTLHGLHGVHNDTEFFSPRFHQGCNDSSRDFSSIRLDLSHFPYLKFKIKIFRHCY